MMTTPHEMEMNLTLSRIEVCDLTLALLAVEQANPNTTKWTRLRAKLQQMRKEFDESLMTEEEA